MSKRNRSGMSVPAMIGLALLAAIFPPFGIALLVVLVVRMVKS